MSYFFQFTLFYFLSLLNKPQIYSVCKWILFHLLLSLYSLSIQRLSIALKSIPSVNSDFSSSFNLCIFCYWCTFQQPLKLLFLYIFFLFPYYLFIRFISTHFNNPQIYSSLNSSFSFPFIYIYLISFLTCRNDWCKKIRGSLILNS